MPFYLIDKIKMSSVDNIIEKRDAVLTIFVLFKA